MTMIREMPAIDAAINEESWEFLSDYFPTLASAVQREVSRGAKPDDIRRHVLQLTLGERRPLAVRCEQAAAHLIGGGDG